ncbi:hypothetical protein [Streptomyces sp. NPDC095613]|uniref:SCO2400 family protein n=1 Tax=Streptomyces sp. NPDC095613 TaxID=3155540 RepID=UPI0033285CAB
MDYCHPCRRYLNGAVLCPGCGVPVRGPEPSDPEPAAGTHAERAPERGTDGDDGPGAGAYDVTPDRERTAGRRASRRPTPRRGGPRRARSKRGRRAMTATVGVVLAVGALSLAELAVESPGDDRATSVEEDTSVDLDGGPGPRETGRPADPDDPRPGPGPSSGAAASGSARPDDGGSGTPSGTPSGRAQGPGAAEAPPASPGGGAGTASRPAPPGAGDSGPDPAAPSEPPGGATPDDTPAPPASSATPGPEPTPEPSETCAWFQWWCD